MCDCVKCSRERIFFAVTGFMVVLGALFIFLAGLSCP